MAWRGVSGWGVVGLLAAWSLGAGAKAEPQFTPAGQAITPTAAAGALFQPLNPDLADLPGFTAGQASALALSPDGRTLLILTSGFNRNFGKDGDYIAGQSNEYVFVYDVSGATPVKRQVLRVPDSFLGLAWAPGGDRFFVSGGVDDDVLAYGRDAAAWTLKRTYPLGHKAGLGLEIKPAAAGLAVSPDGRRLLVANYENDSVSLIDLASGKVTERDLRPGVNDPARAGAAGGTFPKAVAFASNTKAYVASQRDRELIVLSLSGQTVSIGKRIRTQGQPVALVLNTARTRLYAALDNTDAAVVFDTRGDRRIETIATAAPAAPVSIHI